MYLNDEEYEVGVGDVVDVPVKTRFAVEGKNMEYLAVESPAWFPEQAFIVDSKGKVIEDTKK